MSEVLGEAQILISANTKPFIAQIEELRALVSKPIVVPVTAVGGAGAGAAASTRQLTTQTEALAGAQRVSNQALERGSKAAAEHAKHLEQLSRGAGTAGLSFLGLRAQVLAASGAFVAGAAGALILRKSIAEASALTEEINKSEVVFKRSAEAILEWSKTTARSFGIARVAALQAAGQFGSILVPMGVLPRRAAVLSQSLVELAADMASFNNVDPSRTLEALRAGLVGQSRPLRVLGVQLTAARVNLEAMRQSGKTTATELTQQEKILARYSLILQDAAIQMGDFARTQGRLANQSRILRAQLADLGGSIGETVTPALTREVQGLNLLITGVGEAARAIGRASAATDHFALTLGGLVGESHRTESTLKRLTHDAVGGFVLALEGPLAIAAELFGKKAEKVTLDAQDLGKRLKELGDEARKTGGPAGIVALSDSLNQLITALNQGGPKGREFARALAQILADLQLTGKIPVDLELVFQQAQAQQAVEKWWGVARDSIERGLTTKSLDAKIPVHVSLVTAAVAAAATSPGTGDDLRALQAQAEKQREFELRRLRIFQANPTKANLKVLQAATAQRKETEAQIASILNENASIQQKAATDAQNAAKNAADAAARQTQAFIDGFLGGKETLLRRRLERAANTPTVADDLRINEGLRRILKARLKAIQDRIKSLHLHGEALRIAQQAIKSLGDQIASLNATIDQETAQLAEQRAANAQAALDARQAHLEAILSIAETTPQTGDDRRALEALIKFDEARIAELKKLKHRTREQNALLDSYRVDLAQRREALRNLKAEQDKVNNAGAELAFSFLQAQQGFAANLLGNLIPGGLTGGLVGGGSGTGSSSSSPGLRQVPGGFEDPARGLSQQAGRDTGVRSSQASTTNHLLQQILNALERLNGRAGHPESRYQRHVLRASMDGVHGN